MFRILLLVLLACVALPAQQEWENVRRLPAGEPITVVRKDMKSYSGRFAAASDHSISLRAGTREFGIDRADVLRITSHRHSKRLRNALIGAGAGVAVGAVVNGTLGSYLRNEGQAEAVQSLIWILPIGFGTGMGAAMPGYPTVYRSR